MKNLIKSLSNFFKGIWGFIDKKIILPITKVITFFTGKYDVSGKKFEN